MGGHGSYPRVEPEGARVARFWCPVAKATVSLLPSFLAARRVGTLDVLEAVMLTVEESPSLVAAAEALRAADAPDAVTSISAMRWLRRQVRSVRAFLVAVVTLLPELVGCAPTIGALRVQLGTDQVLVSLRSLASRHLPSLPAPVGLCARGRR